MKIGEKSIKVKTPKATVTAPFKDDNNVTQENNLENVANISNESSADAQENINVSSEAENSQIDEDGVEETQRDKKLERRIDYLRPIEGVAIFVMIQGNTK